VVACIWSIIFFFAVFMCVVFPIIALLLYRELDEFQQERKRSVFETGMEKKDSNDIGAIIIDPSHMNPIHPYSPSQTAIGKEDFTFGSALERELWNIWCKDALQLPICVDFPRLASRIEVIHVPSVPSDSLSTSNYQGNNSNWLEMKKRELDNWTAKLLQLIKLFEQDPQKCKLTEDYITKKTENSITDGGTITNLNLQVLTEEIISKILGNQSKTVRVLKAINQEIIQPAVYRAKNEIFKVTQQSTKDIHTSDGWRIYIQIKEDTIEILHERMEQSMLKSTSDKEHFKVQWRFVMCFDQQFFKLLSAQVFILHIDFHNNKSTNNQFRSILGPIPSTDN